MIIATGFAYDTKETVIRICTSCHFQNPIYVHKIFQPSTVGKCEICSKHDKLWTIIAHRTPGVAHQIISEIGFYRIVMMDRLKETYAHHADRAVRP